MANSNGYKMYAGLRGSNVITVGTADDVFNFTDLASAVSFAKPKDLIQVYPGTYTVTSAIAINKDLTIVGIGAASDIIITSAIVTTGATVTVNVPASHNASVAVNFDNLTLRNTSTGSAVQIDNNGGAAQDLYVNFQDCNLLNTSTGYALEQKQTTTTKDMFVTVTGSPCLHSINKSVFARAKALSVFTIVGMKVTAAIEMGTTAVASTFNMLKCAYASTAVTTGGDAAQIQNYVGNYLYAATPLVGAATKGAASDFDATGTEAAILYA